MEIRKEIMDFALLMERVMRKHDRYKKDSWKDCKLNYLEKKLVKEYNKWKDGTTECPSKDEVINIANFCMMLFHRYDMNGVNGK